ncbi:MAG: TetR/AcrR family transcriptional regulator [Pseudomonadota bacterium]
MRFAKTDWIELGLKKLESNGPPALTIEELCAAANRTRGSFYHHFTSYDDFVRELIGYWMHRDTDQIIESVRNGGRDPVEALNLLVSGLNHRLESNLRQFVKNNSSASRLLEKADQKRIKFLTRLYEDEYAITKQASLQLAQLEYAAYVGAQTLWPNAKKTAFERLGSLFGSLVRSAYQIEEPKNE